MLLLLLAEEETLLQGMNVALTEIVRCYRMTKELI